MPAKLPPGPRLPRVLQTIAWWNRTVPFLERCRERYGKRFTMRLLQAPPFVHHSQPEHLREIFTAPPEVLHPGEGAKLLEPVVGSNSVILLDERAHLSQRKLMLPAFHGEKMQRLSGLMQEVTERELARWPEDEPIALHPRLQALTLEIIMRAVFGLDSGDRLDAMRSRLSGILEFGARPASTLPALQRGRRFREFVRSREHADALIYETIDERRESGEERDDILAMLLEARHEDGSPMSPVELRDELMTLLVAGHETTANSLAWAYERLARTPGALARVARDPAYAEAAVRETLRLRPVIAIVARRLTRAAQIGGRLLPEGTVVTPCILLVHRRPDVYLDPDVFRPERFLERPPGTYTWIPFGGGVRRCIGATFAQMELQLVLETIARRVTLEPVGDPEPVRRRAITLVPARGGEVRVVATHG
jgi:cytochrome P450